MDNRVGAAGVAGGDRAFCTNFTWIVAEMATATIKLSLVRIAAFAVVEPISLGKSIMVQNKFARLANNSIVRFFLARNVSEGTTLRFFARNVSEGTSIVATLRRWRLLLFCILIARNVSGGITNALRSSSTRQAAILPVAVALLLLGIVGNSANGDEGKFVPVPGVQAAPSGWGTFVAAVKVPASWCQDSGLMSESVTISLGHLEGAAELLLNQQSLGVCGQLPPEFVAAHDEHFRWKVPPGT